MILKALLLLYFVCNSLHCAKAENEPEYILACDEFLTLDFNRFESQLEGMKTGNDLLRLHLENIQFRMDKQDEILKRLEKKLLNMDKQEEILKSLEKKIDNIPHSVEIILQSLEEKLIKIPQNIESKIKTESHQLNDLIGKQYQLIQTQLQESPVNDKWQILSDIKKIVKGNNVSLESFEDKLKRMENVISKATLVTRELGDSVFKNITVVEKAYQRNGNGTAEAIVKPEDQELVCNIYPSSCSDFQENYCDNNKCRISNPIFGPKSFVVACDSEGGGWTVIQRRINGSVDFYRNWSEYKAGFGDIDGEFFIGLEKLHALTTALQPMELMIQLQDFDDIVKYAKYDGFVIGNETDNYKLIKVGSYSGTAGDSFSYHQGFKFTTKDRDNDMADDRNCAITKMGAWWYQKCLWSNLNGKYYNIPLPPLNGQGICWGDFHGYEYSMKFVQMMIRPKRI